jgi:hypothetical protein
MRDRIPSKKRLKGGCWDMGRSEKIDCRANGEVGF